MKLINSGADKEEYLLEQYKLYLAGASEVSDRRQKANEYYLTVNTVVVSLSAVATQIKNYDPRFLIAVISVAGLAFSIVTYFLLRSYKQLNSAKFQVIHELESKLPANLYAYEWQLLGEGNDTNKYWPFSHLELKIPLIFGAVYLVLLAAQLSQFL